MSGFAQTAAAPDHGHRHLAGQAILRVEQPYHPLGLADARAGEYGLDLSLFATGTPPYAEVLEARAGRVAMVRDFLAAVSPDQLAAARTNP